MGSSCSRHQSLLKPSVYIKSIRRKGIKIPLSQKEISILKKTWPTVKLNWLKICLIAFEKWFSLYPQLRYMFRNLPVDLSFADLFKTDALKMHVEKLRDVIEMLLQKVNDVDDFVHTIIEFGKQHHTIGAEQKYATALAASFQYGICMITDVGLYAENAWDSLFRFVMNLLKMGMRLQKDEDEKQYTNDGFVSSEVLTDDSVEQITESVVDKNSNTRTLFVAEADPNS